MPQWLSVHGNQGTIQDPNTTSAMATGGGWRVTPLLTGEHWIHFAIPTLCEDGWRVDRIRLTFHLSGPVALERIELFDGRIRFWEKNVAYDAGHPGQLFDEEIDLGQAWNVHVGLGLSIQMAYYVNGHDPLAIFHSAGARFLQ